MSASRLEEISFAVALEKCLQRLARDLTCAACGHPHLTAPKGGPVCHCGCTSQISVTDVAGVEAP